MEKVTKDTSVIIREPIPRLAKSGSNGSRACSKYFRQTCEKHERMRRKPVVKRRKKKGCRQKSRDSPAVSLREFNPRVVQQFEIECEKNKQRKKLGVHKNKRLKQIKDYKANFRTVKVKSVFQTANTYSYHFVKIFKNSFVKFKT